MPTSSIWVPCEAFDVVVTADDDEPTDFEKAVMLFLLARRDHSMEDVVAFLGLGERLAMDLVIGLWRQGYIIVDTVDGGVRLDPAWETRVQAGSWGGMKSAHRVSDTVELMRELVSGQLVADRSRPSAPQPDQAVPVLVTSTLEEVVTATELAAAAIRSVGRNSPLASRIRKVHAEVARPRTRDAPRPLSWIRLEVEAQADTDDPRCFTLRPVATEDVVLARIAPAITRVLNDWALGNADHPVVRALTGTAVQVAIQPAQSLAARLDTLVRDLGTAAADPAQVHGTDYEALAQTLAGLVGEVTGVEAARAQTTLELLTPDPSDYMRHLTHFDHQLVLITPNLDEPGLEAFADVLIPYLKKLPVDTSTVLLWGDHGSPVLPKRAASFLANVAAETAGPQGARLRWSGRSARIASTLAILDGSELVYSNVAPLGANGRRAFGFALRVRSGAGASLPRRLLEIARERAPEADLAETIRLRAWSRDAAEAAPAQDVAVSEDETWGKERPEPPADAAPDLLAMRVRAHDLLAGAKAQRRRLAAAGASVDAVVDAALFRTALEIIADSNPVSREETLWVGFGQDQSGRTVPLHRLAIEAVAARAAAGLTTIIMTEGSPGLASVDLASLPDVAAKHPKLVKIAPVIGLVGHFVCGERRFVTAPGGLASPAAVEVRQLSSRVVGLAASDSELCRVFREACVAQWPHLATLGAGPTRGEVTFEDEVAAQAAPLGPIHAAWAAAGAATRRQSLAAELRRVDGFTGPTVSALDALTRGAEDVATRAFRRDILAVTAANGDVSARARALQELGAEAWSAGDWQPAAVLFGFCEGSTSVAKDLADATAGIALGLPLEALPEAFQGDGAEDWIASVTLAIWAVLFNGDAMAAETLEIKLSLGTGPAHAEPLHRAAEAVLQHWGASGGQVDFGAVRALVNRTAAQASLDDRAGALCDAYRLGLSANYNNNMLKRVVPRFYTTTSDLRPVVDALSPEGGHWDRQHALTLLDRAIGNGAPDDLADDRLEAAHRTYAAARDEPIQGRKGAAIRLGARELMRRARELQEAIRASQDAPAGPRGDSLSSLLTALSRLLPKLLVMADEAPAGVAGPLVAALAARITQLTDGKV